MNLMKPFDAKPLRHSKKQEVYRINRILLGKILAKEIFAAFPLPPLPKTSAWIIEFFFYKTGT